MTSPYNPPWTHRPVRRGSRYSSLHLRVSDAERAEVADRLAKHYADGRLDQTEFNERLDQAMGAKTQADLHGLFNDLPPIDGADVEARRASSRRPRGHQLLFIALVVALIAAIGTNPIHFHMSWLLVLVLVALWVRSGVGHRR
jgi:hypothetical protein